MDLGHTICVRNNAVSQLLCTIFEGRHIVICCLDSVGEFFGAVDELRRAVGHLLDLVVHVAQSVVVITCDLVVIDIIACEQVGEDHGHRRGHGEICDIRCDLDGTRDIEVIDLVLGLLRGIRVIEGLLQVGFDARERILEPRESHADDDCVLALGDDRAVVDLDIPDFFVRKSNAGHRREGDIDVARLLGVGVIDMNGELTGLACQLVRVDGDAVQIVGDLGIDRRLLRSVALIIDVAAVSVPGEFGAVLLVGLVALDIFNIGEIGLILELAVAVRVFQPVADRDVARVAICIREDVDRLLLLGRGRCSISHNLLDRALNIRGLILLSRACTCRR